MDGEKMTKEEFDRFTQVKIERKLTVKNQEFIAGLHARLFNHTMYIPCGCSPTTWNNWIAQLNTKYDEYRNAT